MRYGAQRALGKAFITLIFPISVAITPAHAEVPEIVALGDSLTAGYGLAEGEGFVPQLQAWLDRRGHDVIVLNGGLSGDTAAGGRVRIADGARVAAVEVDWMTGLVRVLP